MADVFQFIPKAELDAKANVGEFIRRCRDDLTVFGEDLDWDNWNWKGVVNYTKVGVPSQGVKPEHLLSEDIMPFAKAYIRYQQGHAPTKNIQEIKAIRCVEPALIKVKGVADITRLDVAVLDEAAIVAREQYGGSGYHAGAHLERLSKFLSDSQMIPASVSWKNPVPRYEDSNSTGEKGNKQREEKLPSDYQLEYMAEMFANNLQAPRDRYTTSIFGLGVCAPGRISEFQDLPVDCIHEEYDRKGECRLGLRFYAGKGYGAEIKWVSTPFVSIAKEAVKRLTKLSAEGRRIAKWYEDHPDKFFRHENCPDVAEDAELSAFQICMAMGWKVKSEKGARAVAFNQRNKWLIELSNRGECISLKTLNKYIHQTLPPGWPWKNKERGIKYSDALLCLRKNEMHSRRNVSPVLLWTPNNSLFTYDLGPRRTKCHRSIWMRHGYTNPDGTAIKVTSHQLRHLLNTVAQRGDLGQLDIAMWSGRANIHQNRTYNHMSEYEVLAKVKGLPNMATMMGPLEKVKRHMPVTLKDLDVIGEGAAHVTEYGFCVHDFSMLPCQKHMDCINCTEQVCIKGDSEKLARLKMQRDKTKEQLEKAESGMSEGLYGAGRWYDHQKKTLDRTNELIRLLESDGVEDGAVIRLRNDQEYSSLKREVAARESQPKPDKGLANDEVRALLGGGFG